MPICSEKELTEKARVLWLKARSAFELNNHGYAISLLQNVLKEHPGFLEARKMLRSAEIAQCSGKKGSSLFGSLSSVISRPSSAKRDPFAAMEAAEKALESDPYSSAGNNLLKEAALGAALPEIAVFALETLLRANPKDTKVLHELGELYLTLEQTDRALEVFNRITSLNPGDLSAIKRAKDAAAVMTLKQGGWETAKSYRDLIKDKDEAKLLEQKGRTFKDVATIDGQLEELGKQYEANHRNVDVVRRIAELMELKYEQTSNEGDLAGAVQWYAYCNELLQGGDPALVRKHSDLHMLQLDHAINALEKWFSEGGDAHPEAAQYREQLQSLKSERCAMKVSEARKRVERNPTDLQLRFELGERLVEEGEYSEAIPELQRARQNPNVRLRAMSLLGKCFIEKGMNDLAVQQLKAAASEMLAMDAAKKDTLYSLALLHEAMGNRVEYLEALKEIYEADYNYRDVSSRVESSYAGSSTTESAATI